MDSEIVQKLEENLKTIIVDLKDKLTLIRASGASASLVSNILVNYYETKTPLSTIANIKIPDPTLILIAPFDPNSIAEILKAISNSPLNLTAQENDGTIRIFVPPLNEEKRLEFTKKVKEISEQYKISIRNTRQDAMKKIRSIKDIAENQEQLFEKQIQDLVDKVNKEVDQIIKEKSQDLLKL